MKLKELPECSPTPVHLVHPSASTITRCPAMSSIPLAPYPSSALRASIPPPEWSAIVSSWSAALSVLLQLPASKFAVAGSSENTTNFLLSYLAGSGLATDAPQISLRKNVFLTIHRVLSEHPKTALLTTPGFLTAFARVYARVAEAQRLLDELWKSREVEMEAAVKALKTTHLPVFQKAAISYDDAAELGKLFQASPKVAATFLAGDEFVEVAMDGGEATVKLFAKAWCEAARVNWSVVIDGIYSLTSPSGGSKEKALLEKLMGLGVGAKLEQLAVGTDYEGRVAGAVEKLQPFGRAPVKRKKRDTKGKGKAAVTPHSHEEAEIASKVDTIRDLLPDFGTGFLRKCLKAMDGDTEAVTMALLDGNLPAGLDGVDRNEE